MCRPTLRTLWLCSTITHTVWAGSGLSNNTQTKRPFTQLDSLHATESSVHLPTLEMSSVLVRMLEDMSTMSGTSPVSGTYWNSTPVTTGNNNMITISHMCCIYPCCHGEQQHDYHQSHNIMLYHRPSFLPPPPSYTQLSL